MAATILTATAPLLPPAQQQGNSIQCSTLRRQTAFKKHIPIKSTLNWSRIHSSFILNYLHPVQR